MEASQSQSVEDATRSAPDPSVSSPSAPRLNPRSCVTCRRRKVRCNKQSPCANCTRAGIECVFPGPGRAPRKSRKHPDTELLARLQRLEGVVHSLGAHVDENGVISSALTGSTDIRPRFGEAQPGDSPASDRSDPKRQSIDKHLGRLVINEDRSRYVSSAFWTTMSNEIAEMRDLLDPSSTDEEDETLSPAQDRPANHQAFVFGYSSVMLDLREFHPTPSQIFILWEVFKENVDPVVRILHRPTARTILMTAAASLDRVSKPAEALLFSIYNGAVVSLSPEQCRQLLDEDKDILLKKYRFATEQALARADFMNSSSLMCLQALVLFLIVVRHGDDSRLIWALGGLTIRLAQGLGLHRDGSHFGLNPFETEMRRRLWWHLSLLDNHSAEDHGTDPIFCEGFSDTKLPLNLGDDDIYPGMKQYPAERQCATEMTFCLIRFELSTFFRRLNFSLPRAGQDPPAPDWTLKEKEEMIDDCHRMLEEKYLRHCDMDVPIYWVAATVARLILAKMWLMVHQPRAFSPVSDDPLMSPECRDRVFITSVEVIEFSHLLEKNDKTARWGWLFRSYIQWQSVAYALSEICTRPPGPHVDRAWRALDALYEERNMKNSKMQKALVWKPLRHLMAKARARRAAQQAAQVGEGSDVLFADPSAATSLERFMHDYPDDAVASAVLGDPDLSANSITAAALQAGQSMPEGDVGGIDLPADLSELQDSDIFNFEWPRTFAGFPVQAEAFSRHIMNVQEDWF